MFEEFDDQMGKHGLERGGGSQDHQQSEPAAGIRSVGADHDGAGWDRNRGLSAARHAREGSSASESSGDVGLDRFQRPALAVHQQISLLLRLDPKNANA